MRGGTLAPGPLLLLLVLGMEQGQTGSQSQMSLTSKQIGMYMTLQTKLRAGSAQKKDRGESCLGKWAP